MAGTFELITKLEEEQASAQQRFLSLQEGMDKVRCEILLNFFKNQLIDIKKLAPNIEQLRGVSQGLQLSAPMIAQHVDLCKRDLPSVEDVQLLKYAIKTISNILDSVKDAAQKQKEEYIKTVGRLEGMINTARNTLGQALSLMDKAQRSFEVAQHDELDTILLQHYEQPEAESPSTEAVEAPQKKRSRSSTKKKKLTDESNNT